MCRTAIEAEKEDTEEEVKKYLRNIADHVDMYVRRQEGDLTKEELTKQDFEAIYVGYIFPFVFI